MKTTVQLLLDRLSIGASMLCALHCMFLPILLSFFPAILALPVDDHEFHQLLVWITLPSSMASMLLGCWCHKDIFVLLMGGLGLASLVATAWFGHDILGEIGERAATILSALVLAYAHWRNFTLCRNNFCEHGT